MAAVVEEVLRDLSASEDVRSAARVVAKTAAAAAKEKEREEVARRGGTTDCWGAGCEGDVESIDVAG